MTRRDHHTTDQVMTDSQLGVHRRPRGLPQRRDGQNGIRARHATVEQPREQLRKPRVGSPHRRSAFWPRLEYGPLIRAFRTRRLSHVPVFMIERERNSPPRPTWLRRCGIKDDEDVR